MKNWQKVLGLFVACGLLCAGCKEQNNDKKEVKELVSELGHLDDGGYNQLKLPTSGEEIVVIETNKGVMKFRLFPEEAPKASENFLGLIEESYYDETVFHRIIENFMVQGGSPDGTGFGGESIYGAPFEMEVTEELHHIRGALAMARSQDVVSQTSQFYIVHKNNLSDEEKGLIQSLIDDADMPISEEADSKKVKDLFPVAFSEHYLAYGGEMALDYQYTVFGQLFEGFDVLDAIATTETEMNESQTEKSVPVEEAKVIKMYTETYE